MVARVVGFGVGEGGKRMSLLRDSYHHQNGVMMWEAASR